MTPYFFMHSPPSATSPTGFGEAVPFICLPVDAFNTANRRALADDAKDFPAEWDAFVEKLDSEPELPEE